LGAPVGNGTGPASDGPNVLDPGGGLSELAGKNPGGGGTGAPVPIMTPVVLLTRDDVARGNNTILVFPPMNMPPTLPPPIKGCDEKSGCNLDG
jgi:hypothetical protein